MMWKLMLPALKKAMQKNIPEEEKLVESIFLLKRHSDEIKARLNCESGNSYGSPVHKESTFYDIMMKNSNEIKEDWSAVTLTINFQTRKATTTTFDQKNQIISTNIF